MTLIEIDDDRLLSLLPATTSELAMILSGTTDKKSETYKRYMTLINRHMESMKRYNIVEMTGIKARTKTWGMIQ